jgi:hypothetical protein
MKRILWSILWLCLVLPVCGQERTIQNRPYIDLRKFHYGFTFGIHSQSLSLENNGYIDPQTGQQWFATNDRDDIGFTVGVLGEWRLNTYFALRMVPSMCFGSKHIAFREQVSGKTETQDIKSTFISLPVSIKISAPRFNNYRPYVLAGLNPVYDLTTKKQGNLLLNKMDCYVEVAMGCDFYLPFFKLIPELKFSFGLADLLNKNRDQLIDKSKLIFTESVNSASAKMVTLSFYFE